MLKTTEERVRELEFQAATEARGDLTDRVKVLEDFLTKAQTAVAVLSLVGLGVGALSGLALSRVAAATTGLETARHQAEGELARFAASIREESSARLLSDIADGLDPEWVRAEKLRRVDCPDGKFEVTGGSSWTGSPRFSNRTSRPAFREVGDRLATGWEGVFTDGEERQPADEIWVFCVAL